MLMIKNLFPLVLFWVSFLENGHGDLFTALTNMEHLITTLNVINQVVDDYIKLQENRLDLLKRYALSIAEEVKKVNEDSEEYLFNPINDFILIKRLTADWNVTKGLLVDDFEQEFKTNATAQLENLLFPSDEDLYGATLALIRLQDTYRLNTTFIARGELNGVLSNVQLTYDDCFKFGKAAYDVGDYYLMFLWMVESLNRFDRESDISPTVQKWEILDYLAYGSYLSGNDLTTLRLTCAMLKLHPQSEGISMNIMLHDNFKNEDLNTIILDVDTDILRNNSVKLDEDDYDILYKQVCSRQGQFSFDVSSRLRCRYVNYGKPFLMLAPFKEEEACLNPRIVLFRQVLYPSEIDILKSIASPRLKRSKVFERSSLGSLLSNYRISQSGWLQNSDHPLVQRIRKRIEDMTSLSMETAESLQVANYGIGGHYSQHYDFLFRHEEGFENKDDRIATLLFYMTNVKQGGATVFPLIDVALWPEEGTAAFWYNLYPSGRGDFRTLHGACPVLQGSKWITTQWIHLIGQEFTRPCTTSDL